MPPPGTLPGPEMEALMKRFLAVEPAVTVRELRRGLGFLCGPPLGAQPAPPRLFAVATEGGVLLRLGPHTGAKVVDNGVGEPNAALPDWIRAAAEGDAEEVVGAPDEWVWVPVPDAAGFERRRPHVQEALAYCRHQITMADR